MKISVARKTRCENARGAVVSHDQKKNAREVSFAKGVILNSLFEQCVYFLEEQVLLASVSCTEQTE